MILMGMTGTPEVAFWSATRHLIKKAMEQAPDVGTQRAYMIALEHAEERLAYYLTGDKPNAACPPTSPAPKSA
jgi:hypothetical protein